MSAQERRRRSKLAQIVSQRRFIRGTFQERLRVCGNPNCRCAQGHKHRAPYLVVSKEGRPQQLYVPEKTKSMVRQWVGNYRDLRDLAEMIFEFNWDQGQKRRGYSLILCRILAYGKKICQRPRLIDGIKNRRCRPRIGGCVVIRKRSGHAVDTVGQSQCPRADTQEPFLVKLAGRPDAQRRHRGPCLQPGRFGYAASGQPRAVCPYEADEGSATGGPRSDGRGLGRPRTTRHLPSLLRWVPPEDDPHHRRRPH